MKPMVSEDAASTDSSAASRECADAFALDC